MIEYLDVAGKSTGTIALIAVLAKFFLDSRKQTGDFASAAMQLVMNRAQQAEQSLEDSNKERLSLFDELADVKKELVEIKTQLATFHACPAPLCPVRHGAADANMVGSRLPIRAG